MLQTKAHHSSHLQIAGVVWAKMTNAITAHKQNMKTQTKANRYWYIRSSADPQSAKISRCLFTMAALAFSTHIDQRNHSTQTEHGCGCCKPKHIIHLACKRWLTQLQHTNSVCVQTKANHYSAIIFQVKRWSTKCKDILLIYQAKHWPTKTNFKEFRSLSTMSALAFSTHRTTQHHSTQLRYHFQPIEQHNHSTQTKHGVHLTRN